MVYKIREYNLVFKILLLISGVPIGLMSPEKLFGAQISDLNEEIRVAIGPFEEWGGLVKYDDLGSGLPYILSLNLSDSKELIIIPQSDLWENLKKNLSNSPKALQSLKPENIKQPNNLHQLGADYLLTGSFSREEKSILLFVEIWKVLNQHHMNLVDTFRFEIPTDKLFEALKGKSQVVKQSLLRGNVQQTNELKLSSKQKRLEAITGTKSGPILVVGCPREKISLDLDPFSEKVRNSLKFEFSADIDEVLRTQTFARVAQRKPQEDCRSNNTGIMDASLRLEEVDGLIIFEYEFFNERSNEQSINPAHVVVRPRIYFENNRIVNSFNLYFSPYKILIENEGERELAWQSAQKEIVLFLRTISNTTGLNKNFLQNMSEYSDEWLIRGQKYYDGDEFNLAKFCLQQAIRLEKDRRPEIYSKSNIILGKIATTEGDFKQAITYLERGLQTSKNYSRKTEKNIPEWLLLAENYINNRRFKEAETIYLDLEKIVPENGKLGLALGDLYLFHKKNPQKAKAYYSKFISPSKDYLKFCYEHLNKPPKTCEYFQPQYMSPNVLIALLRMSLVEENKREEWLLKALALDGNSKDAQFELKSFYLNDAYDSFFENNYGNAYKKFKASTEYDTSNIEGYFGAALSATSKKENDYSRKLENYKSALKEFQNVLTLAKFYDGDLRSDSKVYLLDYYVGALLNSIELNLILGNMEAAKVGLREMRNVIKNKPKFENEKSSLVFLDIIRKILIEEPVKIEDEAYLLGFVESAGKMNWEIETINSHFRLGGLVQRKKDQGICFISKLKGKIRGEDIENKACFARSSAQTN